jgi:hypothetical protein
MILGIRVHQDNAFREVTNLEFEKELDTTPVQDDHTVIVVNLGGSDKAYPLLYIAQHHVVNEIAKGIKAAITFCPMCHSVVVYDTSDIGRLYVATLYRGNLVLADYRTKTFFQQNTGEHLAGPLNDVKLEPIYYEQLSFSRAKEKYPNLQIAKVSSRDLSPFKLPVPFLWDKILKSEFVPTLDKRKVDKRLPARERIIGVDLKEKSLAYKKRDILRKGYIQNKDGEFVLIAVGEQIEGYKFPKDKEFSKEKNKTNKLEKIQISDEYWFAWAYFHPMTELVSID